MKKTKRPNMIPLFVSVLVLAVFVNPVKVYALMDRASDEDPLQPYLLDESWADFFESQPFSFQELQQMSLPQLAQQLWAVFVRQLQQPVKIALRVAAVLVLLGLFKILYRENASPELDYTLQSVLTVTLFLLLSTPVLQLLQDARDTLDACRLFLAQFIPVLCSVLAANGQAATAVVYSTVFYSVILAVAQALYSWIAPLVRIFLALSITKGLCGSLKLDGFVSLFKRSIHWVMGLVATLFGAYLSFQGLIANTGDSLALRAGKFVLSGGVPIVGGAVSDAIGTVYAGLKLVKNAAGVVAIAALVLLFLPLLAKCLAYTLVCSGCAALAQLLDNPAAKGLLEGLADSIRMLGAILVLFALLLALALALALLLTAGGT